ncbi:hypothetical protein PCE1_001531 [Barthelona sp. PCE]
MNGEHKDPKPCISGMSVIDDEALKSVNISLAEILPQQPSMQPENLSHVVQSLVERAKSQNEQDHMESLLLIRDFLDTARTKLMQQIRNCQNRFDHATDAITSIDASVAALQELHDGKVDEAHGKIEDFSDVEDEAAEPSIDNRKRKAAALTTSQQFISKKQRLQEFSSEFEKQIMYSDFQNSSTLLSNMLETVESVITFSAFARIGTCRAPASCPGNCKCARAVYSVSVSPNAKYLMVSYICGMLLIFDFESFINDIQEAKPLYYLRCNKPVAKAMFFDTLEQKDDETIVVADLEGNIYGVDITVGTANSDEAPMLEDCSFWRVKLHTDRIYDFDIFDNTICTVSKDKMLCLINFKEEAPKFTYKYTTALLCCSFSPDGRYVAFGSSDHIAQVLDVTVKSLTLVLKGHSRSVSAVKWLSKSKLVTSGIDSVVRVWRLGESERPVSEHRGHISRTKFTGLSVFNGHFCVGSENHRVVLYSVDASIPILSATLPVENNDKTTFVSTVEYCKHSKGSVVIAGDNNGDIHLLRLF